MTNAVSAATAIAALAAAAAAATAAATNSHSGSIGSIGSMKISNHSSSLSGGSGNTGNGSGNDNSSHSRNHSSLLLAADHLPLQLTTAKVDQDFEIDIQLLTNGYDGTTVSGGRNRGRGKLTNPFKLSIHREN